MVSKQHTVAGAVQARTRRVHHVPSRQGLAAATDLTGMDAVNECSPCTQFEVIATDKPAAYLDDNGRVGSANVDSLVRVLFWNVKKERC